MKAKGKMAVLWAVGLIGLLSCKESPSQQDPELLSTEVIHNPQTMDDSGKQNESLPVMSFEKTTHDFGIIKQGEQAAYAFKFTNSGKGNLMISTATASCGCTVPYYPRKPLGPGEEESIKVTFDSKGKRGTFKKEITITANTIPSENKIYITGDVQEQNEENKAAGN